jgi:hypothetical protein
MSRRFTLAILSDIHYAGPREQAVGDDYETRVIPNPVLRFALSVYRTRVWLRHPLRQNGQLDRFLATVPAVDYAIANGDYSCNTSAFGLSDDAAMESARGCVEKLRARFGERLRLNFGDHELGKLRLMGTRGGLRLRSWERSIAELGLQPFWRLDLGNYVLFNCVSTLLALPLFAPDMLPGERPAWEQLRAQHLDELRAAFASLRPEQRVLFFCHDPTALSFLARDAAIQPKLAQVEHTIIGHLHSPLYLRLGRVLSGMPVIRGCGHSIRKMSTALRDARHWRPFHVRLCPSLAGIELLDDGGYLVVELDGAGPAPARVQFHPLPRKRK